MKFVYMYVIKSYILYNKGIMSWHVRANLKKYAVILDTFWTKCFGQTLSYASETFFILT